MITGLVQSFMTQAGGGGTGGKRIVLAAYMAQNSTTYVVMGNGNYNAIQYDPDALDKVFISLVPYYQVKKAGVYRIHFAATGSRTSSGAIVYARYRVVSGSSVSVFSRSGTADQGSPAEETYDVNLNVGDYLQMQLSNSTGNTNVDGVFCVEEVVE